MAKTQTTTEIVEALAAPLAAENGLAIWDVRFEKEGPVWHLRVFLEKAGGVTITDCENVARALSPLLDEKDPIQQSYVLEVSSPGLGRKLTKPAHFAAMQGQKVAARFIRPENGKKEVLGTLLNFENGIVTLALECGEESSFTTAKTTYIKLCDDTDLF